MSEYKYDTAWDWIEDKINGFVTMREARMFIRRLTSCIDDPEAIIWEFNAEMDEDGYFDEYKSERQK